MIFVTIGTQQQNFQRLFDYINNIDTNEKIIVQKGKSKHKLNKKIITYDFIPYEEMEKYIRKARIIITHGGGGTVFKALKLNKKVIIVPRLSKYKEHINDHQLEFSKYLQEKNYCFTVETEEDFQEALKKIDSYQFTKYKSGEKEFIKNIENEIDKLLLEE